MNHGKDIQPFDPLSVSLETRNLIEASAGTGKTYSIAILVLRLILQKQIPIQEILMVTFTKAAVAELETRIRQFIRSAVKVSQGIEVPDQAITTIVQTALQDIGFAETQRLLKQAVLFLDETVILTIHSFCQRILKEFAFETKQVFGSEILTNMKALITDRVNAFWRKYITTTDINLLHYLIKAGLSRPGLIKIIESALSGKSMILPVPLPPDFLLPSWQTTINSSLLDDEKSVEAAKADLLNYIVLNTASITTLTEKNVHARKNLLQFIDEPAKFLDAVVSNQKSVYVQKLYPDILSRHDAFTAVAEETNRKVQALINMIYYYAIQVISAEADRYKKQNNQLSFDDMIIKLHQAVVVENNGYLVTSLRRKYKAAFIDEFQDTDKMQYEIFDRLFAAGAVLFYIGDPKQSIYAWRKADIVTYFKAARAVENRFGMNINYRSSTRFIEAMNSFFLPETGFDTFCFSNQPDAIRYIDVSAPSQQAKGELYKNGLPDFPLTIFENPSNEAISQSVVAQIIQLLGTLNFSLEEKKGVFRKIRPSDIGILVRKNKQAAEIKMLLCKFGIPAVTIDDTKLLQSSEARDLLYLLEAVVNISRSSINKALLSPLTGFDPPAILELDDEEALNRFKQYQQLWEKEGVYVMLTKFIADYNVKQVLLSEATENGERIITNTLQMMELLHKTQTQKQCSMTELANWLQRGIEGMETEGDEFEQRIESDDEAIKIVTIHKSKGLEYNIVFAPFLDLMADTGFELVTFRDEASGDYVFSERSWLKANELSLAERQLEQENRRLLYVAITRAVYKCYICKNTHSRFTGSALTPFINSLKKTKPPLIGFEEPLLSPDRFKYLAGTEEITPVYLKANNFRLLEVNWRKLSYTWLATAHTPAIRANAKHRLDNYDEFVFNVLKRGVYTGNLLHFIFERIDFADSAYWEHVVSAALKRFSPADANTYKAPLITLLHLVAGAQINLPGSSFRLKELSKDKRLSELEFDFKVSAFSTDAVNSLSTPRAPFQVRYAEELEGIMNGKIDFFFEHAGKFFVLDWKSNFLGNNIADYSPENILLAMAESNYHLQYLIYTIAVKKFLRLRLPNFDYATDFGGVIYLFVRGLREDTGFGIFSSKPSEDLINGLERFFDGVK